MSLQNYLRSETSTVSELVINAFPKEKQTDVLTYFTDLGFEADQLSQRIRSPILQNVCDIDDEFEMVRVPESWSKSGIKLQPGLWDALVMKVKSDYNSYFSLSPPSLPPVIEINSQDWDEASNILREDDDAQTISSIGGNSAHAGDYEAHD